MSMILMMPTPIPTTGTGKPNYCGQSNESIIIGEKKGDKTGVFHIRVSLSITTITGSISS